MFFYHLLSMRTNIDQSTVRATLYLLFTLYYLLYIDFTAIGFIGVKTTEQYSTDNQ